MLLYAAIGANALYFLFLWLLSAAGAGWLADRKGYGERLGLMFGLILTVVGFVIVLLLPGRPGSRWKVDGPLPWRGGGAGPGGSPPG
jgi:dipeptide/tripeptide permease